MSTFFYLSHPLWSRKKLKIFKAQININYSALSSQPRMVNKRFTTSWAPTLTKQLPVPTWQTQSSFLIWDRSSLWSCITTSSEYTLYSLPNQLHCIRSVLICSPWKNCCLSKNIYWSSNCLSFLFKMSNISQWFFWNLVATACLGYIRMWWNCYLK